MKYTGKWWDSKHRTEPEREFTYGVVKILYIVLIAIGAMIVLSGCEKYEEPTYPQLSGRWIVDGVSYGEVNSNQFHILSDTIILSNRVLNSIDENGIATFTNDWNDPNVGWYDKFIVGETIWEFETNIVGTPDRNYDGTPTYTNWSYYSLSPDLFDRDYWSQLDINSSRRTYTITQYGLSTIKLKLPKVWTMYRYNGEIYFLEEVVSLTLIRI